MLPTVFIAHLQNYSAAARSQRLTVGDHILAVNGASLVGLPLSECNEILRVSVEILPLINHFFYTIEHVCKSGAKSNGMNRFMKIVF